jgi:hypothetical protein
VLLHEFPIDCKPQTLQSLFTMLGKTAQGFFEIRGIQKNGGSGEKK